MHEEQLQKDRPMFLMNTKWNGQNYSLKRFSGIHRSFYYISFCRRQQPTSISSSLLIIPELAISSTTLPMQTPIFVLPLLVNKSTPMVCDLLLLSCYLLIHTASSIQGTRILRIPMSQMTKPCKANLPARLEWLSLGTNQRNTNS